jgi:hypothetical protein
MKTFKEFLNDVSVITERYYEPNEKRPSGTTPLQAAKKKGITGDKLRKVERGADNKEVDASEHPDYKIKSGDGYHYITHKPTGIEYTLQHFANTKKGTPIHTVSWHHSSDTSKMSPKDKTSLFRTALKVGKDIQHRLPHGSVAEAQPEEDKKGNRRALAYSKLGMGEPTPKQRGMRQSQFAVSGRNPSPRQAAKGKTRFKPINPSEVDNY